MIHNGAPNSTVIRFTFRSMLPLRCQLSINGPKARCSRNHRFSRSEERANANAATSRNGVVGNNGNTTPTAPMATDVRPAISQKNLMPLSNLAVHHTETDTGRDYHVACSSFSLASSHSHSRDSIVDFAAA